MAAPKYAIGGSGGRLQCAHQHDQGQDAAGRGVAVNDQRAGFGAEPRLDLQLMRQVGQRDANGGEGCLKRSGNERPAARKQKGLRSLSTADGLT